MEKQLADLVKGDLKEAAFILGLFYGKIKLSKRLSTFYGLPKHLDKVTSYLGFYVSRKKDNYVCIESYKLSAILKEILKDVVNKWEYHSSVFTENFTKGYIESNITEVKLGDSKFFYIKGKKRILKSLTFQDSFLVKMSTDYILYILDNPKDLKKVSDFDQFFNIKKSDQYKAIIGLILGHGHIKSYDYIQITQTNPQEPYIRFLKIIFDYWGITSTIGNTADTGRVRKDGSKIINHYFYISLDNKKYFKNRVSLQNKQVNSYLASRLNHLALLFWFLDNGNLTDSGANFFTNGFDSLSQNMLIKYLRLKFNITPSIYTNGQGYNYLHLSVEDTKKLMSIITPYMSYLPRCFKNKFKSFKNPLCII